MDDERTYFQKTIYELETRQRVALELLDSLVTCRRPRKKDIRTVIRVLKRSDT